MLDGGENNNGNSVIDDFHEDIVGDSVLEDNSDSNPDLLKLVRYQSSKSSTSNKIHPYNSLNSIYIGVLTCKKYLSTRAISINNTWGNIEYLTSDFSKRKIEYFAKIPKNEYPDYPGMNVNNLEHIDPNLDDKVYPPQQKAFSMLQHICQNELNNYKWFIRADDDVYVDINGLEKLLDRIDSNRITYLGQAGSGWVEHRDKLGLYGHNFCMGGPGVVFSHALMKKMCPHISKCKTEIMSKEEDVELGRCVLKYAGVECTHSWEGIKRFHHAYDGTYKGTYPYSDDDLENNEKVRNAMTLHHVKIPWIMYKIHRYFLKKSLHQLTGNEIRDNKFSVDQFFELYNFKANNNGMYDQTLNNFICPNYNKILYFDRESILHINHQLLPLSGKILEELIHVSETIYDELMKVVIENEKTRLSTIASANTITNNIAKKNLQITDISGFILEKNSVSDKIGYVFDVEFKRVNDEFLFSRRVYVSRYQEV